MEDYTPHREWLITRQEAKKVVVVALLFNYTEIRFEFDLKRHSRMAHSVFIIPAAGK